MINLKKNGKKGFTLAELLIVVAIIAVLTAIAVPLFVGALNKAEKSVQDANIRAVRGTAVVFILNADRTNADVYDQETGKLQSNIWVQATVSSTGEVSNMKFIAEPTTDADKKESAKKDSTTGNYTVIVHLTDADVKIAAKGS